MEEKTGILKLLNMEKYITSHKLKEVKNANIFGIGKRTFDEEGLWSEIIFGRVGSKERRDTFGFLNLGEVFITPVVYKMMVNASEEIRDILAEKREFIITADGELKEDPIGETGLLFLTHNYKKIKFDKVCKKNKFEIGAYLEANKDLIFIEQYLILPAGGLRDMSTSKANTRQFTSEINELYERLISLNNQLFTHKSDDLMASIFAKEIQKVLIQVYTWIQTRLEGKQGLLRGTLLKKTLDYSARIIATSDPNIPLGYVGLPWHTLMTLYEPFVFHYILKKDAELNQMVKDYLNITDHELTYHDLKDFSFRVIKNPESFTGPFKDKLFEAVSEVVKDKEILVKRDPVVSRTSYYSATPWPLREGRGAVVNVLTCPPLGLDFDGDTLSLMPIFTKEATEQAAKLNPRKSKSVWINPMSNSNHIYSFALDVVSTVYSMTKE